MSTNNNFIPFALPDIGQEEIDMVVECLKSGWLTTGPNAKKFEENFGKYLSNSQPIHCISVNSASMGIRLILDAHDIGAGDEVIVPTYTFSATAMMPYHTGATPVLVDIDSNTLNIDIKKIEQAITPRTKVIMPVHFAGLACDMEAINTLAQKHGIKVIEDAAHALPSTSNGKLIGNRTSDGTIFSFYATKTITTGEGGMIVTHDENIAQKCKKFRLHGISKDVFDRYTSNTANWYYEITEAGHKCNMTDLAASIGIVQLQKATDFAKTRGQIAEKYFTAFADLPLILPAKPLDAGELHPWHLFVIRLKKEAGITRNDFINKMKELGIGCSVHFIPLHYHPFWQEKLGVKLGDFPVAEAAYESAVSLPIYTKMSDNEIERVINAVRSILC